MMSYKDALKKLGIETWFIGHTKIKEKTDETTGEVYRTLNFNQDSIYAKGIRGICHVIATGYYDRKIESVEVGKVNPASWLAVAMIVAFFITFINIKGAKTAATLQTVLRIQDKYK